MDSKDPWDFTPEEVIERLCYSRDLWADRPTAPTPDPSPLSASIKENFIDGPTLLCNLDHAALKDSLNIQPFGQRVAILHAITKLQEASPKYQSYISSLNSSQPAPTQPRPNNGTQRRTTPKRATLITSAPIQDDDNFSFVRVNVNPHRQFATHRLARRSLWRGAIAERITEESPSDWDAVLANNPAQDIQKDPGISCKIGEHEGDAETLYFSSDDSEEEYPQLKTKGLSMEEIADTIDAFIAEHNAKWKTEKEPKVMRRAQKIWTSSRGRNGSYIAARDRARLDHFHHLLAKTRQQISSDDWKSTGQLRSMCAALEVTLDNIEEYRTRLAIHSLTRKPECLPSPKPQDQSPITRTVTRVEGDEISLHSGDDLSDDGEMVIDEPQPRRATSSTCSIPAPPASTTATLLSSSSEYGRPLLSRANVEALSFADIKASCSAYALVFKLLLSMDVELQSQIFEFIDTYSVQYITKSTKRFLADLQEPHTGLSPIQSDADLLAGRVGFLYLCRVGCSEDVFFGNTHPSHELIGAGLACLTKDVPLLLDDMKAVGEVLESEDERLEIRRGGKRGIAVIDSNVAQKMTSYQCDGLSFLWREIVLAEEEPGCLLAHTMGLGKTMQAITFVAGLVLAVESPVTNAALPEALQRGTGLRVVVICPAGLIDNWYEEIELWLPQRLRATFPLVAIDRPDPVLTSSWASTGGIALMSFDMLARFMRDNSGGAFEQITNSADVVIADEAHRFKNEATIIWKAVQSFKTARRIALTGSPLANNINEYINLLNWVAPKLLESTNVRRDFELPIQQGFNRVNSTETERDRAKWALRHFLRFVEAKVHRRGESCLAASLPPKNYFVIKLVPTAAQVDTFNHLTTFQSNHRATARRHQLLGLQSLLAHLNFTLSMYVQKFREQPRHDMETITPAAPPGDGSSQRPIDLEDTASQAVEVPSAFAAEHIARVERSIAALGPGGAVLFPKPAMILQIIDTALALGERVVLFSHWRPILTTLETWLRHDYPGAVARMDGHTKPSERQQLCKALNAGRIKILLASPRAAGLGLNMQGASRVILADFTFNPVWEQQAVARLWRLGQTRPVSVYHLVVDGTFEAQLFERTVWKRELALEVVDGIDTEQTAGAMANLLAPPAAAVREDLSRWRGRDAVVDRIIDGEFRGHVAAVREVRDDVQRGAAGAAGAGGSDNAQFEMDL